jgi:hypothetical protein
MYDIKRLHDKVVAHKNRVYAGLVHDVVFAKTGKIVDVVVLQAWAGSKLNTAVAYRYEYDLPDDIAHGVEIAVTPNGDYVFTRTHRETSCFDSIVIATLRFLQHGYCKNCHSLLSPVDIGDQSVCRECGRIESHL